MSWWNHDEQQIGGSSKTKSMSIKWSSYLTNKHTAKGQMILKLGYVKEIQFVFNNILFYQNKMISPNF